MLFPDEERSFGIGVGQDGLFPSCVSAPGRLFSGKNRRSISASSTIATKRLLWRGDGGEWNRIGIAYRLDGYHHNTFGDFRRLAPAVFVSGEGPARLDSFRHEPLELK